MGTPHYGCVLVTAGKHKGRIAFFDDDGDRANDACIHFGDLYSASTTHTVRQASLRRASLQDLFTRRNDICNRLGPCYMPDTITPNERVDLVGELVLIESELGGRMLNAREKTGDGLGVFISHSSLDKFAARWIGVELAQDGYEPWLDEWQISVGDTVPAKICEGLDKCYFLVILLSRNAVESGWVEHEWQSTYWQEVMEGRTRVLPVLLEDCAIPALLRTKKYADLRASYNHGLQDLLLAMKKLRP